MSINAIRTGLSGLQAYQKALDNSAHNVANSNTLNFQAKQVTFKEQANGGVEGRLRENGLSDSNDPSLSESSVGSRLSQTDLSEEIVNSLQFQRAYEVSVQLIRRSDEVLDSLLKLR